MRLTDFDALSFDCYGTLIDWEAGIAAGLEPWAQTVGLALDTEDLLVAYSEQEAAVEREHGDWLYSRVLAEAFRRTAASLGEPVSDEQVEAFGLSVPQWPAFGDSTAALRDLQRHYQLIILSNVDRQSFAGSNERLGIDFNLIVTAEDVGSYKPNLANFAALQAGAEARGVTRLLHVAQSLFHDHVPAKQLGWPTVWINRRHDRWGWGATPDPGADVTPDWEFPSMAAFAAAVDTEFARSE
jgi:2-haloacid dehalogenase